MTCIRCTLQHASVVSALDVFGSDFETGGQCRLDVGFDRWPLTFLLRPLIMIDSAATRWLTSS